MSAPRKIWVAPWMFETPHQNPVRRKNHDCDGDHTYHHEDVVRELVEANARLSEQVEALSSSVEEWRSLAMDYVSKDPLYSSKAAIAKIAQEG